MRRTAIVAGVLGLLFAVGCGGDDESDAEEALPLAAPEYQQAISTMIADSAKATSLYTDLVVRRRPHAECSQLMERFDREVQQLIERAAELRPPEEVASAHQRFVKAARESLERVADVGEEVESGKTSCGDELNDELYGMPSSESAEEAIAEIEEHGYVVFGR